MPTKRTRDAEATKERILRAAEGLFAKKGFAGTTMRSISKRSGASGPLIVFHFKSKRGLYKAVKASIMRRFFAARDETPLPEKPFSGFIEHVLRAMFRFYRENPTMMRLATWDRLEGDVDPWPEEDEWHHAFWERIRQAQKDGEIRDDLTPLNISIMICGAAHFWWEYHEHFMKHMRSEDAHDAADDAYFRQCMAFVIRGLSMDGKPPTVKKRKAQT
jgi:TetR/AcrR family transcriptional regulator